MGAGWSRDSGCQRCAGWFHCPHGKCWLVYDLGPWRLCVLHGDCALSIRFYERACGSKHAYEGVVRANVCADGSKECAGIVPRSIGRQGPDNVTFVHLRCRRSLALVPSVTGLLPLVTTLVLSVTTMSSSVNTHLLHLVTGHLSSATHRWLVTLIVVRDSSLVTGDTPKIIRCSRIMLLPCSASA